MWSMTSSLENFEYILQCIVEYPTPDFILSIFGCVVEHPFMDYIILGSSVSIAFSSIFLTGRSSSSETPAKKFIKSLKDVPNQEAIDKIRAKLDEIMSQPITPQAEDFMDTIHEELEKRTG